VQAAFQPYPIPWSEFPTEFCIYLVLTGILHLVAFAFSCIVLPVLAPPGRLLKCLGRLALFLVLLLLIGAVFNGLWSCLVWDRLYHSVDYTVDFMPFWPITQGVIDEHWGDYRGRLLGVSLFQLQLVWAVFAAGTWGVTVFLYRAICRGRESDLPAASGLPHDV
jgi:hypothetical protein